MLAVHMIGYIGQCTVLYVETLRFGTSYNIPIAAIRVSGNVSNLA